MDRQPPFADAITVPDAPAIPGLILRCFRGEADNPLLVDLYNRTVAADQVDLVTTVDELAHWFTPNEHFDPACDLLLAEVDGAVIAYGNVAYYAEVDARFIRSPVGLHQNGGAWDWAEPSYTITNATYAPLRRLTHLIVRAPFKRLSLPMPPASRPCCRVRAIYPCVISMTWCAIR